MSLLDYITNSMDNNQLEKLYKSYKCAKDRMITSFILGGILLVLGFILSLLTGKTELIMISRIGLVLIIVGLAIELPMMIVKSKRFKNYKDTVEK